MYFQRMEQFPDIVTTSELVLWLPWLQRVRSTKIYVQHINHTLVRLQTWLANTHSAELTVVYRNHLHEETTHIYKNVGSLYRKPYYA